MEKPNAFWRNVFSVETKMQSFDAVWIIENPKKKTFKLLHPILVFFKGNEKEQFKSIFKSPK